MQTNKEKFLSAMDKIVIRNIVERTLEGFLEVSREQCVPTARLVEDLKADSLDQIEIVLSLETEFNIEISDEETEKLKTVGDILTYVEQAVQPQLTK